MAVQLRLNVDQISAAIMLLIKTEEREIQQRLSALIGMDQDALKIWDGRIWQRPALPSGPTPKEISTMTSSHQTVLNQRRKQ